MKEIHKSWSSLLHTLITIAAVTGTAGIALKFVYFQILINSHDTITYAVFPYFPNLLDSAFLICSVIVAVVEGYSMGKRASANP